MSEIGTSSSSYVEVHNMKVARAFEYLNSNNLLTIPPNPNPNPNHPAAPQHTKIIACTSCRKRKTKCDHLLPICTSCLDANSDCHYPLLRPRKLRNGLKNAQQNSPSSQQNEALDREDLCRFPIRADLEAWVPDPFDTYPVPSKRHVHFLVDHFANSLAVACDRRLGSKLPLRTEVLPAALVDPAIFHAMLCLSGSHFIASSGHKKMHAVTLAHRGEALRLINICLQESSFKSTPKVVMLVVLLAGYELIMGEGVSFQSHMRALSIMIKAIGGLEALGIDGFLEDLVIWFDQMSAITNQGKLHFPSAAIERLPSVDKLEHRPSDLRLLLPVTLSDTGFRNVAGPPFLDSNMVTTLQDIFTFLKNFPKDSSDGQYDVLAQRALIYRHLSFSKSAYIDENTKITFCSSNLQECCRLTAIMFMNSATRGMPVMSDVHRDFGRQVKLRLTQPNPESSWDENADVRLWILFMSGAVFGNEYPLVKKWYVESISQLLEGMKLRFWQDTQEVLRTFLWDKSVWEPPCRLLWGEVERLPG